MFIRDLYAISPQGTHDLSFEKGEIAIFRNSRILAVEPNYAEIIPAPILRRMGKAVRMGVGAGLPLIRRNQEMAGIIIGTANGGLENCIGFLNQIVDYDEGVLTPTQFVQSTTNAVAGQLALMAANTGYNMTHVNGAHAFENSLLDAMIWFMDQRSGASLLVGAVEEISDYNFNIDSLSGRFKEESIASSELLSSSTSGSICGEGATMFVVSNDSMGALAKITDVALSVTEDKNSVISLVNSVLDRNGWSEESVDLLVLGNSGDGRWDYFYHDVSALFPPDADRVYFKNLVGEYRTASGFATYMTARILSGSCPSAVFHPAPERSPKRALIYNHFDGLRHSVILMEKPD